MLPYNHKFEVTPDDVQAAFLDQESCDLLELTLLGKETKLSYSPDHVGTVISISAKSVFAFTGSNYFYNAVIHVNLFMSENACVYRVLKIEHSEFEQKPELFSKYQLLIEHLFGKNEDFAYSLKYLTGKAIQADSATV